MSAATTSPTLLRLADPPADDFGPIASLANFRGRCIEQAQQLESFARLAARMGCPRECFGLLQRRTAMLDLADRFGEVA